jgi:hypothetical protein
MQSCITTNESWLSNHEFENLHQQLTPIFRNAILSMVVEGVHRQSPYLRLRWLSHRFRSESQSASGDHAFADDDDDDGARGVIARSAEPATNISCAQSPSEYDISIELSEKRSNSTHMKAVFEQHKDLEGGLSKVALTSALKQVGAPILSHSEGISEDDLFRRADSNSSGFVDFIEFKKVANLPDELEMFLSDHDLRRFAPALRVHASGESNQLDALRIVTTEQMRAAVTASTIAIEKQLHHVQQLLEQINNAQEKLQAQLDQEPGKYHIRKMEIGTVEDFHKGLTDRVGSPNLDYERAMMAEHCTMGAHDYEFTTGNYKIATTPKHEWLCIVGDQQGQRTACSEKDMSHGRRIVPIEDMLMKPLAKKSKMTRAEMIAVVLYTGPMFVVYNGILRRFPQQLYDFFSRNDNTFSTTIFVLVSAVQKLSRVMNIPPGTQLYRGLGGTLELPDSFNNADENGCTGFTEFGFMSTTADRAVAVQYSGVKDNKPQASIFEIHPNAIDRGADISEFSQYPGEKEFLFVPMSFLQGEGRCRVEVGPGGGVLKVISVRININIKGETVEQLTGKKKSMHITAFKSANGDTEHWMRASIADNHHQIKHRADADKLRWFIEKTINQLVEIKEEDEQLSDDVFVNDLKYRALVTRMLSSQECAKQKLWLWYENQESNIVDVGVLSLKSAHRQWLSFLKQRQHAVAEDGGDERRCAAVKILQCKGLMTSDNALEEADGEPLIGAAVADGWALEDVKVCNRFRKKGI